MSLLLLVRVLKLRAKSVMFVGTECPGNCVGENISPTIKIRPLLHQSS